MSEDPYATLGVSRSASDAELRAAYRRLVQLHHPDHNHGSAESAQRFEAVQEAYARIREQRAAPHAPGPGSGRMPPRRPPPRRTARTPPTSPPPASDPGVQERLAALERQLREAQEARMRVEQAARKAAREASSAADVKRPSDEELGYIRTDDSFAKILGDAREALFGRLDDVPGRPEVQRAAERAADLLDELSGRLRGERRKSEGE
jgi:hypothetical protein